jgi:hypothetical protein
VATASSRWADAFLELSKRMKAAGQTQLRKELHKAVRDAAKPLLPKVREAARQEFPQRGGLNERVARKPYRAQARTGAKTAGVRITAAKMDPRLDQGRIAHPVFGRPGSTVVQQIPGAKGYFSETLKNEAPGIRGDIEQVLEDFTRRLAT